MKKNKTIKVVNWIGVYTLFAKETKRFCKVYQQTIIAPAFTSLLFFLVISILFSLFLSSFSIYETAEISLLFVLFCGIIASSAMILPGISGSLILVILGVYAYLIKSIDNLEFIVIFTFILGAIIGLLGFSRILKYLFKNHRNVTYTIMLGLVIGSIEKVWPWNKSFSVELSNLNLLLSVSLVILGFIIVFLLEKTKNIK